MPRRPAPKNCYWRGPILWGRIVVAGKEHKWSLRTSDAGVAKRRVKAERERLVAAVHFGEQRHRYEDVVAEWAMHVAEQIGPETAKRYATSLGMMERELLPLFIDEIDKKKVQEIVARRKAEGASIATIKRDLTALSGVLEYAEDKEYREGNPALSVAKKLKERRDPIVLPQSAHVERVIARAPDGFGKVIGAARLTGARRDELAYAERANFDRARRQLRVKGKRNKARTLDLNDEAFALLDSLPVALGCRWLFWHSQGEPFRSVSSNFRRVVGIELKAAQKAAQQAGLSDPDFRVFRFHDLRHLYAVEYLKNGGSIYDLQMLLGHTSIKTTEMYLEFLTPEEARRVKQAPSQSAAQSQRFAERKSA